MEQIAIIYLLEIKCIGKKDSEDKLSIFLLHAVIATSDTNSTNEYAPKNIFGLPKCKYEDCTAL